MLTAGLFIGVLAGFALALPADVPKTLQTRCSTPQDPDMMAMLDEARPDTWIPVNNTIFHVYQKAAVNGGRPADRQYILVHFQATPSGSTGCELFWNTVEGTTSKLQAKQYLAWNPPFRPTWNNVVPRLAGPSGAIDAAPVAPGVLIKTTCSNSPAPGLVGGGYGLAFVFKLSDEVEASAATAVVSFDVGRGAESSQGPFLRYGC